MKLGRNILRTKLLLACCVVAEVAMAAEFQLATGVGYDENPFRLNETFPAESDQFLLTEVRVDLGESSPFFARLTARTNHYLDQDRADSVFVTAVTGYETELGEAEHELRLSLIGVHSDRTYVSRFTGDTFQVRGFDAGDRYDYSRLGARAEIDFQIGEQTELMLDLQYREQNYEDFDNLTISNLDYGQFIAQMALRSQWGSRLRYDIVLEGSQRDHDSRQARGIDGRLLPDSVLEYDYEMIGLNLRYRLTPRSFLYAEFELEDREDNAERYYSTEMYQTDLIYRHFGQDGSRFTLSASFRDNDYVRNSLLQDIETEAEAPSSRGWRFNSQIQRAIYQRGETTLYWFAEANYWNYDSPRNFYEYSRLNIETGLRVEF